MPAVMPGRALAGERALGAVRQGAAAHQGPQRPRLLLRPDARGGRDRPRAARGALVPRPAEEPLPDPGEVPRRDPAALRPHARARVHHEGRLLVPRRRRGRASASTSVMYDDLHAHLRALRARASAPVEADTGAIGGTLSHEFQVLAESGEDAIVALRRAAATRPTSRRPEVRPLPPARAPRRRARARRDAGQAHRRGGERVPRRAAGALHEDAALRQPTAATPSPRWCAATTSCREAKLQAALGGAGGRAGRRGDGRAR